MVRGRTFVTLGIKDDLARRIGRNWTMVTSYYKHLKASYQSANIDKYVKGTVCLIMDTLFIFVSTYTLCV